MTRTRERRPRAQALFAAASVAFLVAAFVWLDDVGARTPAPLPGPGAAPTGAWVCPHGGGSDLSVTLSLVNPGDEAVTARITHLGSGPPSAPEQVEVPAGATVRADVEPQDRGAATYVEFFGGWIAAGWVASTEDGVAAEPCAADASRRWFLADGTTQLEEEAYTIVTNPFSRSAVLDVVLYTADQAPVRHSELTGLLLPARRSLAIHLNERLKGEPVVAVSIEATVGRIAAASLGISGGSRVRSALGWTGPSPLAILPTMQGSGQTELLVLSTADGSIRFGVTALTEDQPRPAGGLTEQEHGPAAARVYAVPVEPGPTALRAFALDDAQLVAALRALGPGQGHGRDGRRRVAGGDLDPVPGVGRVVPLAGRRPRERRRRRGHRDDRGRPGGGRHGGRAGDGHRPGARHGRRAARAVGGGAGRRAPRARRGRAAGRPHGLRSPQLEDAFALSLGVPLPHEP